MIFICESRRKGYENVFWNQSRGCKNSAAVQSAIDCSGVCGSRRVVFTLGGNVGCFCFCLSGSGDVCGNDFFSGGIDIIHILFRVDSLGCGENHRLGHGGGPFAGKECPYPVGLLSWLLYQNDMQKNRMVPAVCAADISPFSGAYPAFTRQAAVFRLRNDRGAIRSFVVSPRFLQLFCRYLCLRDRPLPFCKRGIKAVAARNSPKCGQNQILLFSDFAARLADCFFSAARILVFGSLYRDAEGCVSQNVLRR
ncbi:MAG: hypothetical protein IJL26_03565 [Clostridia bacterium]|nr:hypothetical protein [Clostridia bacterium]